MTDKTHRRPILCARNRHQMKKLEKEEDCIILEFDPFDEIDMSKLSLSNDFYDEVGSSDIRLVSCAKNKDQMKKLEKKEDCFILEFDPYDEIDLPKLSVSKCSNEASSADICVVAEKGQVACRDYPHSRNNCATYPFEKTPHDRHCKLCFCYVCDSDAPCPMWLGSSGHCHAFSNDSWNKKREERKLKVASGDYPHYRHNCAVYSFIDMPHDIRCKKCYCYVCDLVAPCPRWLGPFGHCHAFNNELWNKKRVQTKSKVKQMSADMSTKFKPSSRATRELWKKPQALWVKLNIDGSLIPSTKAGAFGGILRNDRGQWMWGFMAKHPNCSVDEVEVRALLAGLELAWERRVAKVEIEMDSASVINWIRSNDRRADPLQELIDRCKVLLHMPWETKIAKIHRTANTCADLLAKSGHVISSELEFFDSPPELVRTAIKADCIGAI